MPNSVFRANIDRYLELLNDPDLSTERRAIIVKLLIEEQDKLSPNQEQLQFAESRLANGRDRLDQLRAKRDGGTVDPARADHLIATFEITQRLLEHFCDQLFAKVVNSRL